MLYDKKYDQVREKLDKKIFGLITADLGSLTELFYIGKQKKVEGLDNNGNAFMKINLSKMTFKDKKINSKKV